MLLNNSHRQYVVSAFTSAGFWSNALLIADTNNPRRPTCTRNIPHVKTFQQKYEKKKTLAEKKTNIILLDLEFKTGLAGPMDAYTHEVLVPVAPTDFCQHQKQPVRWHSKSVCHECQW